jgi:hypothetical protein
MFLFDVINLRGICDAKMGARNVPDMSLNTEGLSAVFKAGVGRPRAVSRYFDTCPQISDTWLLRRIRIGVVRECDATVDRLRARRTCWRCARM